MNGSQIYMRKNYHRIHLGRTWTKLSHYRNVKNEQLLGLVGAEEFVDTCGRQRNAQTAEPHISRELRDFSLEERTSTELKL